MAMKEWFRRLQPVQLYLMLAFTCLFFLTQLVMSHMTHALTLLVDSYHMLCNLIALTGCIITIKYGSASMAENEEERGETFPTLECHSHDAAGCSNHQHHHHNSGSSSERRLKNTFGWARIDVLVMLIGCVFLNSLCFSLIVEAIQTLIHIEHRDEMHHPIPVLVVGAVGLLLNGLCYLLIGGYTFHQASFLHVTASGEVVLDHVVTQDSVRKGQRRLSAQSRRLTPPPHYTQRQGPWEMCRDIIGCVIIIVCSLIVYFTDQKIAKFIDPILSIVSAISLLILSYPYMKESGCILLQTIPDTINIDSLRKELLKAFPDILNVHDLHVWRLTASKVFSTAHIIFLNNKDYARITKEVVDFFHDQGITQVTIQPEFFKADNSSSITVLPSVQDNQCLVPCRGVGCHSLHCCAYNGVELLTVSITPHGHSIAESYKPSKPLNNCKEAEDKKTITELNPVPDPNVQTSETTSIEQETCSVPSANKNEELAEPVDEHSNQENQSESSLCEKGTDKADTSNTNITSPEAMASCEEQCDSLATKHSNSEQKEIQKQQSVTVAE